MFCLTETLMLLSDLRWTSLLAVACLAIFAFSGAGCQLIDTGSEEELGEGSKSLGSGWTSIESPAGIAHINSINFVDGQRGWMATDDSPTSPNRGAWYTEDGGKNWEHRRNDFNAYEVRFDANGERVWMGGSDRRELWVSDDGHDFRPMDNLENQDWISGIYFWDDNTGILTSETGDRVHRTTDGAESFVTTEFGRETATGINNLAVLGDEVWLPTGPAFNTDGTGATLLYSPDRGENWDVITLTDEAHHYKGGSLQAIHVVSSDEIWVAGGNRQMFYTKDGMQTWTQVKGVPSEVLSFNGIAAHGDHFIAVGGTISNGEFIYESQDGGESWELTVVNTEGVGSFDGLSFPRPDLAFAYGYNGTLARFSGR